MQVTLGTTTVTITETAWSIVLTGLDMVRCYYSFGKSTPVNTVANDFELHIVLDERVIPQLGNAPFATLYKDGEIVIPLSANLLTNKPTWTTGDKTGTGAQAAVNAITPLIRKSPSGGGGGQVDTIVPGAAIDVDSTDPQNPIVAVLVDGVTIGVNGSNQLEVPAGGGGYVPTTRTISTTAPLTGGGDLSANRTIAIPQATALVDGYLDNADWTIFNAKQPAGSYITALTGDVAASGPGAVTATIQPDSVTNAKLADVPAATFKLSPVGAGTVNPIDGTANQASTILDTATDPFARTSTIPAAGITALTGPVTATGPGSSVSTITPVIVAAGPVGSATVSAIITFNAAGQLTTVTSATITPAIGSITGLGANVATALANAVGSAGAIVVFNGAGGTPTSLVLTNATGLPLGSITGFGANVATALAVAVGSAGAFVTFNGAGGTPSSITLTNGTNLPISGIAGLGTGVDAWLATPSSANLKTAITDEMAGPGTKLAFGESGVEVAYTGTITWTFGAGAAPSGASSLRQCFTEVGNGVSYNIWLTFATTGTLVTNVLLTFPTEFPTPLIPTGFTGANVKLYPCSAKMLTTPSGTTTNNGQFYIARNAADTGFEISGAVFSANNPRTVILAGFYSTS